MKIQIVTKTKNELLRNEDKAIFKNSKNAFSRKRLKTYSENAEKTWDLIKNLTSNSNNQCLPIRETCLQRHGTLR